MVDTMHVLPLTCRNIKVAMVTKENLYNNFWRDFEGEIFFSRIQPKSV